MRDNSMDDIYNVLPAGLRNKIKLAVSYFNKPVTEIRLRVNRPVVLSSTAGNIYLTLHGNIARNMREDLLSIDSQDIKEIFLRICDYSLHSYQQQLRDGYITLKGGHRAGFCGTAVMDNGRISNIKNISSINIRVARQVKGVSDEIIRNCFFPIPDGVLIAGEPGSGKTTVLRDMALALSTGRIGGRPLRVTVIDERGEIGAAYEGIAQNDIGLADLFDGYTKPEGFDIAVRTMSPDIIICDEIGLAEDIDGILRCLNAGVRIIASIHAFDKNQVLYRLKTTGILSTGAFSTVIMLKSSDKPSEIREIYEIKDRSNHAEINRSRDTGFELLGGRYSAFL